MSPGWSKSSIRLKMAQDNKYGITEKFPIKFGRHNAEVLCYKPFGKGLGRKRSKLVDEELVTHFWLCEVIDDFKQSLKQADSAQKFNGAINSFVDFMWINDGVVRVFYDV